MAVCTSSVNMDLEAGVNWPVCMKMFIHKSKLEPICREIGFNEVKVDDSNSLMSFDIPEDADEEEKKSGEEESKEEAKGD